MIPTLAISFVGTIPVDAARAFGGVDIGNIIANEAHIAMKGIKAAMPPMFSNAGLPINALPTTIKIGISKFAVAEFEIKLLKKKQMKPDTMNTNATFIALKSIALISVVAKPVFSKHVPNAKPPATNQSTLQLISLMSSFSNKIYGKRSAQIKQQKKLLEKAVSC